MYNGLIQMPNNIYRAVIYIRLSEADEGKSYESESESITNQRNLLMNFVKEKGFIFVGEYVDDGYYFALQANKRDELNNRISIAIGTINLQLQQGFTYNLFENSEGNATGLYSYATNHNYTSTTNFGELTITKLDEVNHIVSGTFWFDVQDTNGVIHQIRDGSFDMQYTN